MLATELFPDAYISSDNFPAGATLTIRIDEVRSASVKDEKKGEVPKGEIHFTPLDSWAQTVRARQWLYPKTVNHCLRALFGDYTEQWIGRRVTLHVEMIDEPGSRERKKIGAIRVKGSPEIQKDRTIRVKQGLKRVDITMVPTPEPAVTTDEKTARAELATRMRDAVAQGADESYVRAACLESALCSETWVNALCAKLFPKGEAP